MIAPNSFTLPYRTILLLHLVNECTPHVLSLVCHCYLVPYSSLSFSLSLSLFLPLCFYPSLPLSFSLPLFLSLSLSFYPSLLYSLSLPHSLSLLSLSFLSLLWSGSKSLFWILAIVIWAKILKKLAGTKVPPPKKKKKMKKNEKRCTWACNRKMTCNFCLAMSMSHFLNLLCRPGLLFFGVLLDNTSNMEGNLTPKE